MKRTKNGGNKVNVIGNKITSQETRHKFQDKSAKNSKTAVEIVNTVTPHSNSFYGALKLVCSRPNSNK